MLAGKTDDSEIYPALDLKANKTDTYTVTLSSNLLNDKTSFAYVDGRLDLKADANNVFTKVQSLTNFAGTQQMSEVLNLLQITTQLGTVTGDLTGKANQSFVVEQPVLKAIARKPAARPNCDTAQR